MRVHTSLKTNASMLRGIVHRFLLEVGLVRSIKMVDARRLAILYFRKKNVPVIYVYRAYFFIVNFDDDYEKQTSSSKSTFYGIIIRGNKSFLTHVKKCLRK
jgi:hypothetical protein